MPEVMAHYQEYRQVIHWRLMTAMFGLREFAPNFDAMAAELAQILDLPEAVLHPRIGIETLLQQHPELAQEFQSLNLATLAEIEPTLTPEQQLRQAFLFSKLMLNAFGPNTQSPVVSAQEYSQWMKDVAFFEKACGFAPGALRGKGGGAGQQGQDGQPGENGGDGINAPLRPGDGEGAQGAGSGAGSGFVISEEQLRAGLQDMEKEMIRRMALREVLQDNKLASQLTPSMALVEQLLRDKSNLSGVALDNAKRLIRQFVDELADALKLQVFQSPAGKIDRSVPPKRVFRNLDLKRTLWKNLINWDPKEKRLYVDRLYYRQTARKKVPTRMIVVVDQSGSMVDAMVNCTILASIFASLPNVDVHLLAFDTRVLDLTPYIHDPFEVLLRTQLGGGTYIYQALLEAAQRIQEPRKTVLTLISDFFEGGSNQVLFDYIKSLKDSGVHFIPVGSVTSSGYFSVNDWFRSRLKDLGTPILTGSPRKLIDELKKVIVV